MFQVEREDGLPQEVCVLCRTQLDLSLTFKRQVQKAHLMMQHHLAQSKCEINDEPEEVITGDLPVKEIEISNEDENSKGSEEENNNNGICPESEWNYQLNADVRIDPLTEGEENAKEEEEKDKNKDAEVKEEDNIYIKVEDNIVVAEPWPVPTLGGDGLPLETEHNADEMDENERLPLEVTKTEIKEENEVCSSNIDTDVTSSEDEEDETKPINLNLTCTDRIMCSCHYCSEPKQHSLLESDGSSDNRFECELCLETFESMSLLKRHHREHGISLSQDVFVCVHCEKNFSSRKRLRDHQRKHKRRQALKPKVTKSVVEQPSETQPREQTENVRRSLRPSRAPERHVVPHYSCSKCERMYSDKSALENHQKSHLGKPTLKCNHCGKKFYSKDFLEKHIQNAHIGKLRNKSNPLQCNICGVICENRSHLFSHMRSHKSTVHLCEVCGKVVSLNAYPAHKRSHSNAGSEEVFHCDICQKKFNNKVSLRTHKNSYHGTLKYTCEVCGKQFTTMALMKHHQQVHSGKREHVCQVCGRAFTLKITLKSHIRIHTGEMPYKCDNCGRQFTWKTTFRNHVSTCNTNKNTLDNSHVEIPHFKTQCLSLGVPQELPIDFSEEGRSVVPIDYSEEGKYKHILSSQSKSFPIVLHLSEELKYASQQPLNFVTDIKPYSRDMKYPV